MIVIAEPLAGLLSQPVEGLFEDWPVWDIRRGLLRTATMLLDVIEWVVGAS